MRKILTFIVVFCLLFPAPHVALGESINPAFNPNVLIPDSVFPDTKTFGGPNAIQTFLEEKGSLLADTSAEFIKKLREPNDADLKKNLDDPHYALPRKRTAAELIWDASRASGLNAQVILVTLNKEQSLITGRLTGDTLQRHLDHAMGFACPDGGSCDGLFEGFYYQLFGNMNSDGVRNLGAPKSLMRSFTTPGGRGPIIHGKTAKIGDKVVIGNTTGGFDNVPSQQTVTIENRSTAALYRYTPHVFNGNYNFWRFFTEWFDYPNGTILVGSEDRTFYILQKGARRKIPLFVARVRKMNLQKAISVSPVELNNYPIGLLFAPPENTIISVDKKLYVFKKGIKYPASKLVLEQKNLDATKAVRTTQADASIFMNGEQLLPSEGTLLRVRGKGGTYLVQNKMVKLFTAFTWRQYKSKEKVNFISQSEFLSYPSGGSVAPLDGTLIKSKSSSTVYMIQKGERRAIPHKILIKSKYRRMRVITLPDREVNSIPTGIFIEPQ